MSSQRAKVEFISRFVSKRTRRQGAIDGTGRVGTPERRDKRRYLTYKVIHGSISAFSLTEAIVGLAIVGLIGAGIVTFSRQWSQQTRNEGNLGDVRSVRQFIRDNFNCRLTKRYKVSGQYYPPFGKACKVNDNIDLRDNLNHLLISKSVNDSVNYRGKFHLKALCETFQDGTRPANHRVVVQYRYEAHGHPVDMITGKPTNGAWLPLFSTKEVQMPRCAMGDAYTVGLYNPISSHFFMKNSNRDGRPDRVFYYGNPNDSWIPLAGDWHAHQESVYGAYQPSKSWFFLSPNNGAIYADQTLPYGWTLAQVERPELGMYPISGDWDGDGTWTIGGFQPGTALFFLSNTNGIYADHTFKFCPFGDDPDDTVYHMSKCSGWIPITGDWVGDGITRVGLYDPTTSRYYLQVNQYGEYVSREHFTDLPYGVANIGARPIAGDWDGDGIFTYGIVFPPDANNRSFVALAENNGDIYGGQLSFWFENAGKGYLPIAGDWDGSY